MKAADQRHHLPAQAAAHLFLGVMSIDAKEFTQARHYLEFAANQTILPDVNALAQKRLTELAQLENRPH